MKSIVKLSALVLSALLLSVMVFAVPSAVEVSDNGFEEFLVFDVAEELMDDGSEIDPYIISTPEEFNYYANLVNTKNSEYSSKYYKLSCNIDFEGKEIIPFGKLVNDGKEEEDNGTLSFKGTLDGNGYALKNVGMSGVYYSGVIGYMTAGTVKDLSVSYVSDKLKTNGAKYKFGGIVGFVQVASGKNVVISGCETSGDISIKSDYSVYAGGIVAHVLSRKGNLTVSDCVSRISFDVESKKSGYIGGIVAYAIAGSSKDYIFRNCISYGDLSYNNTNFIEATVGGFAGQLNKDESGWTGFASENAELMATTYHFENCIAFGDIYASSKSEVDIGGFVAEFSGLGKVEFKNCFVPEGQSVEGSAPTIKKLTDGASQKSRETLSDEEFYSSCGFDFTYDWYMTEDGLMPRTTAKQHGAADVLESVSLRLNKYRAGLRFTAEIDVAKRDYCYEYGFLVATKDAAGDDELTFDTYPCAVGVSYGTDVDVFFDRDDEKITFTGVIYNIQEKFYSTDVLVRAYVSYECDGEIVTVYGNTVCTNVSETAMKYYNNQELLDSLSTEELEILESMLPKA